MSRLIVPAFLMSVALSASGAELGNVSVRSHIGQQLSADIELVDLSSADLTDLQVRLASPDVFAGASVTMNPALGSMNMSVFRDGSRRVLHLTTLQPVNAELVHIFFELSSGGRQIVRTASLWLTREPSPSATAIAAAPAPSRPAPAATAAATTAAPAAATATATAVPSAHATALPQAAAPIPPAAAAARTRVGAATRPSAASSGEVANGAQRPGASHSSPDEEMMKAAAERAFAARRAAPAKSVAPAAPEAPLARAIAQPARLAVAPAARPAEACSPALLEARTQQCAAMDASNKELTTKLVDLEGKVKRLQTALTAPAAPSAQAPAAPAPAAPAKAAQAAPSAQTPAAPTPGGAAKPAQPAPATVVAPPAAQSASGAITDARAAKREDAKPAVAPAAKQAAVSAPPEEKAKKMSRPRLISLIAGGALGLLALIGVSVHLVRKRRAKGGPLKIWQSFRKKEKAEDAVEPTMEEATESAPEATS